MSYPALAFYLGLIPSKPDKLFIHDYHGKWGDYKSLESNHTYIQWLFPLDEPGQNPHAPILTDDEIIAFRQDKLALKRLRLSFKLMLDFYGFDLDGNKIVKASHWRNQFGNLRKFPHNNRRISRIIKCMGLLGFYDLRQNFVYAIAMAYKNGDLPEIKTALEEHFLPNAPFRACDCDAFKQYKDMITAKGDKEVIWALKQLNLY